MIELLRHTKIDFMGKRIIGLALSGLLTLIGIIAIIQIARGEANLGIDFAGGTSVQVKFNTVVQISDVRKALVDGGVSDFDLQMLPTENKALIRVKKNQEKLGDLSAVIVSALSTKFSESNVVVDSTTEIGPKVGSKLREDAMWAVIAAMIGILAYIAFRFQIKFGIGATMATFHDVTAVLAVFYLMGKEINLLVVSALLMIAGYSLTDTVVVFDRIRENMRSRIKMPKIQVINESINEVLSRTIITSLTTFAAALSLFLFGGEVIHDFALAIMLGIVVGTYSSIFVASPIVLMLGKDKPFGRK